jgi:hypothetical protein
VEHGAQVQDQIGDAAGGLSAIPTRWLDEAERRDDPPRLADELSSPVAVA